MVSKRLVCLHLCASRSAFAISYQPTRATVAFACVLALAASGSAQTAEHVAAVKTAFRSGYAVVNSTNDCPMADADLFGWPKARLRYCEYLKQDLGRERNAVVWLLDIPPDVVARWIESACERVTPNTACFTRVLEAGRRNSGYMFAVTGNVIEDMQHLGDFKNYFFRNGMTVSVRHGINGSGQELTLETQLALAMIPDDDILAIRSGSTRYWGTTPAMFAARFPDAGLSAGLARKEQRIKWLMVVRQEMLHALDSPSNRLLEAWLCAGPDVSGFSCPPQ